MAWFQKKVDESPKTVPAPTGAPRVSELLSEDAILFPPPGADKAAVFALLVSAVCRRAGVSDSGAVLSKVLEREQGISTTLDTGLSLPHARLDGIAELWAGAAVLKTPLVDPAHPDLPIRVVFLFLSPNKRESFPLHLQLLRGVASLFQSPLIDRLAASSSPAEALALLRQGEG
jgi:PTS system nitrogen regulatory IIA component